MQWLASGLRFIRNGQMMKTKKILFTDLDGTLLDDNKQISRRTYEVLDAFTAAGHALVLSSGRDTNSVGDVKEELGLHFPGVFLIGYNGGQIYDCDQKKTVYRVALKKEQAVRIIETALLMDVHCHTYNETHIITPLNGSAFLYYQRIIRTPVIYAANLQDAIDIDPCKCIAVELEDQNKLHRFREKIHQQYDDVTTMFSSPVYLELFPAASGKGTALTKLCEILHIPITNSIAAGDQENDLTMLEAAGTSIAMSNGLEKLKKNAAIVTAFDNNHDGLARVLENYL